MVARIGHPSTLGYLDHDVLYVLIEIVSVEAAEEDKGSDFMQPTSAV